MRWTKEELRARSRGFAKQLLQNRDAFVLENQDLLLESLKRDGLAVCS
jgi:hypothetical protein